MKTRKNNKKTPLGILDECLNSLEGKKIIEDYFNKIENQEKILNNQLVRAHKKICSDKSFFKKTIKRVRLKYESKIYRTRWLNRGIQPPEPLSFFLFEYAKKYGRHVTKNELKKYANTFTSEMYFVDDYFFNLMIGQGAIVQIISKSEN